MALLAVPGPMGFIWLYMALLTMDLHVMDANAHRLDQSTPSGLV